MSFATDVKNELARIPVEDECCQMAELTALMRMGGTILISGRGYPGINFKTENPAVARKVLTLIKRSFNLRTEVLVSRGRRLKKRIAYVIKVVPAPLVSELLSQLGLLQGEHLNVASDRSMLRRPCCRRSYLRGAFLGGGSVNKPEGNYHLELVTESGNFAETLVWAMKAFGLAARMTDRKNETIVYLKDGDAITTFLQVIGAHDALLQFENIRVVKDMRNQVNRLVNCETANLQKTVNASVRQIEKIRRIVQEKGLDTLPHTLREAAEIRLSYPEATLQELVDLLGGRIGKSGMNHRLRKLERIADEMEAEGSNEPVS
ncbi:MAG: sporulation transcription regulator whiA [Firmicutes bacterium]|nr:sporulation transcription regulator whiA [Bacillota bacterium]